jgi:hypothetical protein
MDPEDHYRFKEGSPLVHFMSQMNHVDIFLPYFL